MLVVLVEMVHMVLVLLAATVFGVQRLQLVVEAAALEAVVAQAVLVAVVALMEPIVQAVVEQLVKVMMVAMATTLLFKQAVAVAERVLLVLTQQTQLLVTVVLDLIGNH